jgi:RimJ/RimL family protein N-acetyltransferase
MSLATQMADREVRRHIAPPPRSGDAFRQFIRWTRTQRRRGIHITFGVVPYREQAAVGIFQLWRVEPDFSTAEWGLAMGLDYWGKGLALAASTLFLDFAFTTVDVHRLEARAGVHNVRGNRLLRRLGALPEGRLRQAFRHGGRVEDQRLWSILRDEWVGEAAYG